MIGKEILNYTIVSLIGKGGMGSVYLAVNKYIKQQKVAIKVINGNMKNDFTRQKLAEEADKLARLNHPNIVHFVNYHIDDAGTIYLIMEYADGYSLEDYIKNVSGLIVEEKICAFFEPLLDAFDYAHKHKIIHKDIKPSNIIVTNEGIPKILDFGISAMLDDSGEDADADVIMGTPSYMSPEQVKGLPLDQRSDIYSLGVLLHQMMTGNPPYDTTTLTEHEIYKHVVDDELPRMKTYYKYVSDKVQTVVDKATAKKAEARYQSCQDFRKALHNAIYPPKIPFAVKAVVGAIVVAIMIGGFFVWDYNRIKVSYYKDYVEQWSIPQGIGEISGSDRSHTHRMYRFEYQHYKLQRVSHVNSLGTIIPDGESERYERPLDVSFYYDSDNRLNRAKVMDHNGMVLYIKSFNEKLNTVIFQFNDEYGTEKTIGNETVGYVNAFATDQNKGKISRYLLEYDGDGFVKTLRYAGFQNVYVGDAQGIYGKQYVRDSKGRVIEELYLAHDGSPKATKWGLGKKLFFYDEDDNWSKSCYLTVDGKPALDAQDGTGICENVYDKYGNAVKQYYKNADGQLMIPVMHGVAGVETEYDENGFICKQSYLGIDGNVEFSSKQGYAVAVMECNEYGFFNNVEYMDASGKPCVTNDGCSKTKIVTDKNGNELERCFYNANGDSVAISDGYAVVKAEYDSLGHMVKAVYYGENGEPCLTQYGNAGWEREYNVMGDCVKNKNLGVNMQPTKANDGVCTTVYERDIRGNITKLLYYDEKGKLALSSEGIAVVEYKYDDNGNETSRKFYDTAGKLTNGYGGFAHYSFTYDDKGYLLSERYYNVKNEPVLVDGIAGKNYKNDGRGNIIELFPIGTDQQLATNKLIMRCKYDDKDNMTECAFFNAKGNPAINSDEIHKYTQKFNNRNQCVEVSYFNIKGELTDYSNCNFCIKRSEYDEKGLEIKVSYFDKNNKPANCKVGPDAWYSSFTSQYDNYGRVIRQFYFDRDGMPTDPKDMVPEGVVKYDKRGNVIYLGACNGKGKLIYNPKNKYSYMEREYDNKDNVLWESYFNENKKPTLGKDGYHKVVYTYTESNKEETESYFGTDGKPMLVNGYHRTRYKYNDNNLCIEYVFLGKNGNPVNSTYGFSKLVWTYNDDHSYRDRKYYDVSGKVLLQQRYVNGDWVNKETAPDWRRNVEEVALDLPYDLGDDGGNLVIQSLKIVGSAKVELKIVSPKSKYEMADSAIENFKTFLPAFAENLKQELKLPRSVTLRVLFFDSKGRELFVINK